MSESEAVSENGVSESGEREMGTLGLGLVLRRSAQTPNRQRNGVVCSFRLVSCARLVSSRLVSRRTG